MILAGAAIYQAARSEKKKRVVQMRREAPGNLEKRASMIYSMLFPRKSEEVFAKYQHSDFPFSHHLSKFPTHEDCKKNGRESALISGLVGMDEYEDRRKVRDLMGEFVEIFNDTRQLTDDDKEVVDADRTWKTFEEVAVRFDEVLIDFEDWKQRTFQ